MGVWKWKGKEEGISEQIQARNNIKWGRMRDNMNAFTRLKRVHIQGFHFFVTGLLTWLCQVPSSSLKYYKLSSGKNNLHPGLNYTSFKERKSQEQASSGVSPVRWLCLWPLHISPNCSCFCGLMLLGVNFNKVLNLPGQVASAICHGLGDLNWFSQSWKLQVYHQGWKFCPQLTDGHFLLAFRMAIFLSQGGRGGSSSCTAANLIWLGVCSCNFI